MYQWLLERERDMLEDALARPTFISPPRSASVVVPPLLGSATASPEALNRARQRLYRLLQRHFDRCQTVLDIHIRGQETLPQAELNRYERLKARARDHWVNHPG